MEHEKKKRNKKKKNKQGKAAASAAGGDLSSDNNNVGKQNQTSDSSDVPKRGLQQIVMDSDRESISGTETSRSVEAEKSYWLNREASLEQKIKELQEQLDIHVQREADLEQTVTQLQTEQLSWVQKQAAYEEKVTRLGEETSRVRSIGASFEEKRIEIEAEKIDVAQREDSAAETIVSLNKDNAKLRAQVIEMEMTINNISQQNQEINNITHQNQQLKEQVSDLQSKIQDLESSVAARLSSAKTMHVTPYEDMSSQVESAQALVAKLLSENEKLVEQVNDLKTKLDQKTATSRSFSSIKPSYPLVKNPETTDTDETSTTETDPMPSSDQMPSSAENLDTVSNVSSLSGYREGMPSDKLVNHMNPEGSDMNQISRVSMESGEIVQISLTENDVMGPEKSDLVPITDAPLIGAPFRLISFVAGYVSGADLVQK